MEKTKKEIQDGLKRYEDHLLETAKVFNEAAKEQNLGVEMMPENAIAAAKGVNLAQIAPFWSRTDDSGIVHPTQTRTAVDCVAKMLTDARRRGHVVGAMQSGKTTTSLALQWAGPILYLLEGKKTYPFYIIGNQIGHEDQTNTELAAFIAYYGNLEFRLTNRRAEHANVSAMFKHSPSLATYRGHVLLGAEKDVLQVPRIEDLVHRRVGGNQSLSAIADLSRRVTAQGYLPLMIIDEPQFGASDRVVTSEDGQSTTHKCVLAQIFDRIEQALGSTRDDHSFIGLSATPFEMNDVEGFWEVRQYLTSAYSGFNFFNGRPISLNVDIQPPKTMSLTQFSHSIKIPFMSKVVMSAYDSKKSTTFPRVAKALDYEGDLPTYRAEVEKSLRTAIYALLEDYKSDTEWPVGFCIRAFNNNAKTDLLINILDLDPKRIEVIKYYDPYTDGMSVKRVIARRLRPDLPYVMFVTNRARMADAFPVGVRFFMDFALQASDLNSLLQGLLGRACGYNKKSTVVLSDKNKEIVDAYVATQGGYVHPTSRHSLPVGGFRRGAPTGMLKVRDDIDDETVKKFFKSIDERVVEPNIPTGTTGLSAKRSRGLSGFRTGPILLIAEELGLFEHMEENTVRAKIFPQYPMGFRVARRNDTVYHTRERDVPLKYSLDSEGNCRYTFRELDRQSAARGGAAGRAMGQKDVGQHMEPTVYVEKYDLKTGKVIEDRGTGVDRKPGKWRAFMVTFPLQTPIREIRAATIALPTSQAVYDAWLNPTEQASRNEEEARRGK